MLDKSRIAAAIWPWGTETREQMELAAKEVTEIGYRTFESVKAAIYAFDMDIEAYREVLKRYDLTPISFYFHLMRPGEEKGIFANLDKELEFIAKLGVDRICLQATTGRPEVMDKNAFDYEADLIGRFAEKTKSFGIMSNLHPHNDTYVMYENEIDYFMEQFDSDILQLAPDTAHLVAAKCDPVHVIEKYKDRVNFTHFKDIPGGGVSSRGFSSSGVELFDFTELGTGCVDFRAVFDILKGCGYEGPLCVELDCPPVSNRVSAEKNYKFMLENY